MYLNLVNKEDKSGIKYTLSQFPDGQQQINLEYNGYGYLPIDDNVTIISRMNNFLDLERIICANQTLKEAGFNNTSLYVPYFLGSRSDRKFSKLSNNYLKTVICPIINAQNFSEVSVLDPHSDVLEACLNNYSKKPNYDLVRFALSTINDTENVVLVSPDGGALKKIYDVAETFKIPRIITAMKHRDIATGKITHTEVPVLDQHNDLKYVIVDDICDGGRTFIELAKAIHGSRPTAKIYLIVTHGIFSQGLEPLEEHLEAIFSTNSYRDIESSGKFYQYNVFPATKNESVLR